MNRVSDSIDRVDANPSSAPKECQDLVDEIQSVVERCSDMEIDYDEGKDRLRQIGGTLFQRFNYGSVGQSNGVWGIQFRLDSQPYLGERESIDKLKEATRAAGFIHQGNVNHQWQHKPTVCMFVPDIRRYLSVDHPYNRQCTDFIMVRVSEVVAVTSADNSLLDRIYKEFGADQDRREFGNLVYRGQIAITELSNFCRGNNISYSVMDSGTVFGIPEEQYSPNTDEMYALKRKDKMYPNEYKVHEVNTDNESNCGTSIEDYRIVLQDVIPDIEDKEGFCCDKCGHVACSIKN